MAGEGGRAMGQSVLDQGVRLAEREQARRRPPTDARSSGIFCVRRQK